MSTSGKFYLLRRRTEGGHARVTFVELFFDLVFVFAVTQLTHGLLHHLTPGGALQTLLLLLAVWWVWIYTSWATNWLDPQTTPVRLLLFALMFAGLILSASIPHAFEDRGLWFVGAYVSMQVGRSFFTLWALHKNDDVNFRTFQRITAWFVFSGLFWIGGALLEGNARLATWAAAVLLELAAPALGYLTPGLGRSVTRDWNISGGHIAERCGLFVILALGESVLINGATFAELRWNLANFSGFVVGLVGSIAMWWVYFNIGAGRGTHLIEHAQDPGRIARLAYTYIHVVIVAGIIVSAAADETILAHPFGQTTTAAMLLLAGGPLVFLLGCLTFKWATAGWPPLSHLAGIALLATLLAAGWPLPPLAVGTLAAAILVMVAIWETVSLRQPLSSRTASETS
jgi:low temperature requirement protein LtrA